MPDDKKAIMQIADLDKGNIRIEDVADIFIAEYENALYLKKDELQKGIREAKQAMTSFVETVKADLKKIGETKHTFSNQEFDLCSKFLDVEIDYATAKVTFEYAVGSITQSDRRYCERIERAFTEDLDAGVAVKYKELSDDVANKNTQLTDTMSLIGAMDRKVRLLKAELSKKKLDAVGMGELLQDPTLRNIIDLRP